ncbi:MAG: type IV pilus biogenesis/stability protein PilW [Pseudomonadota bacterium]
MKSLKLVAMPAILVLALTALAACVTTGDLQRPKSDKDAAIANVKLGVAYMQQGNLALAKEKLERAEKQDPKNLEAHTSLAFLYEKLDKHEDAEKQYQTALKLQPDSADVANNYAVYLCRSGNVDRAIKLFDEAALNKLYSTPWAAFTNAGVCLRANKRGADAVSYLDHALMLRPNYAPAVLELGDLQLELGHPEIAQQVVDRYLALGVASPEVLLIGVRAAIVRGDRGATDNYVRRLRRDYPNSAQARVLPQLLPSMPTNQGGTK